MSPSPEYAKYEVEYFRKKLLNITNNLNDKQRLIDLQDDKKSIEKREVIRDVKSLRIMISDLKEMLGNSKEESVENMEGILQSLSAKADRWIMSDSESESGDDSPAELEKPSKPSPKPKASLPPTKTNRRKQLGLSAKRTVSSTTEEDLEKTREKEKTLATLMSSLKQQAHAMSETLVSDGKLLEKATELAEDGIKATSNQQKSLSGGRMGSGFVGAFFSQTYETIRMAIYFAIFFCIFMFVLNIIILFPGVRYVYIEKPP